MKANTGQNLNKFYNAYIILLQILEKVTIRKKAFCIRK